MFLWSKKSKQSNTIMTSALGGGGEVEDEAPTGHHEMWSRVLTSKGSCMNALPEASPGYAVVKVSVTGWLGPGSYRSPP